MFEKENKKLEIFTAQKMFSLRISSVNVTKAAVSCSFCSVIQEEYSSIFQIMAVACQYSFATNKYMLPFLTF